MTSSGYFAEHDCEPLAHGEAPDHRLHLARLLLDGGYSVQWQMEFDQLFPSERAHPPPAAKLAIEKLPRVKPENSEKQCPVCFNMLSTTDECLVMPCEHTFHESCILPWLQKTNSCPLCRLELPTDDKDYEEFKKQKKREAEREQMLEELHDSMYS